MDVSTPTADQSSTTEAVQTVWKFALPFPGGDRFAIAMPSGARVLTIQVQHGEPQIWALVDPSAPIELRQFRIAGTGHPIHEQIGEHVGTFQVMSGDLVFHVFEIQP